MVAGPACQLQAGALDCWTAMLFFFELFLFVLVMLTLALGEFVSRGLALGLWIVLTAFALIGYLLARPSLRGLAGANPARSEQATPEAPTPEAPTPEATSPTPDAEPASPLDE